MCGVHNTYLHNLLGNFKFNMLSHAVTHSVNKQTNKQQTATTTTTTKWHGENYSIILANRENLCARIVFERSPLRRASESSIRFLMWRSIQENVDLRRHNPRQE